MDEKNKELTVKDLDLVAGGTMPDEEDGSEGEKPSKNNGGGNGNVLSTPMK